MHAGLEIHGWKKTWRQESIQVVLVLRLVYRFPVVKSLHDTVLVKETLWEHSKASAKRCHSVLPCLSQSKTNTMSPRITAPSGKAVVFPSGCFQKGKTVTCTFQDHRIKDSQLIL